MLCGKPTQLEFSLLGDDATCPHCGALVFRAEQVLARLREHFAAALGVPPEQIAAETRLCDLALDESLALVELVMHLEELNLQIPRDLPAVLGNPAELTLADLVRMLLLKT